MSLEDPLLSTEKAKSGDKTQSKKKTNCDVSGFSDFIDQVDTTSFRDLFRKNEFRKDSAMIGHVNERLQFYMAHSGLQTTPYKLLDIARSIVLELREYDLTYAHEEKGNSRYPLCQFFVKAVEGIPNAGPFPNKRQLQVFLRAIDDALDEDLDLNNLDERPLDAAALEDRADTSDHESEESDDDDWNDDQRSESSESITQVKEKLRALKVPDALIKNKNAKQLSRMLGRREDSMRLETLGDFGDRWNEWKNLAKPLPEEVINKLKVLSTDVSACVSCRMWTATRNYTRQFPVCEWFLEILDDALDRNNFELLQFEFLQYGFVDLPKSPMQWAALGTTLVGLKDAKIIGDVSLTNCNSPFEVAVGRIGSSVLPSFVQRLATLQGVLVGKADQASQLENKLIAGAVTAAFAVIQYSMKFVEPYVEEHV